MSELAKEACVPCREAQEPMSRDAIEAARIAIPDWTVCEEEGVKQLSRTYRFKNFASALQFSNRVGELAEANGHHPRIILEWGKVTVCWWTHKIGGLHRNDFIMAARCDQIALEG